MLACARRNSFLYSVFTIAIASGLILTATQLSKAQPPNQNPTRQSVTFFGYANAATGTSIHIVQASHYASIDSVVIQYIKYTNGIPSRPNQVTLVIEDQKDNNRIIGKYVYQQGQAPKPFKLPETASKSQFLTISVQP